MDITVAARAHQGIGERRDRSNKTTSRHRSQGYCTGQFKAFWRHFGTTKRRHRPELFARLRVGYARSRHNQDPNLIAWPLPKRSRSTSSPVAANGSDRRDRGSHLETG